MKRLFKVFLGVILPTMLGSCSKEVVELEFVPEIVSSKGPVTKRVSVDDLSHLMALRGRSTETKSSNPVVETIPIVNESQDTVMYIVNYASGWEIISGDKRTPQCLASSQTGNLSSEDDPQWLWVEKMKQDMSAVVQASDDQLSFSREEIELNMSLWGFPDTPVDTFANDNTEFGHYELYSISERPDFVDAVEHLTTTRWHQIHPLNVYCPYKSDYSGRAPAGCGPVAAAQMLYYLQRKHGVPSMFYSSATCESTTADRCYPEFSDQRSDVWDNMETGYWNHNNYYAAVLVANAGKMLNADYGDDGTSILSLPIFNPFQRFFAEYGYSCTRSPYDETIVMSSLMNDYPVIIEAQESGFLGLPSREGHVFLIDGYKRERQIYRCEFRWFDEMTQSFDNSQHPDYTEIRTTSAEITQIKMNWGWRSQWMDCFDGGQVYHPYENTGWYSLTGGWVTTEGTYDNFIHMTYNFQLL